MARVNKAEGMVSVVDSVPDSGTDMSLAAGLGDALTL